METADGMASVGGKKVVLKGPRACSTCARAKSRCIAGPARQEKCERCYRLRKPCSSQTPAPPRKRKEPKPTRVAELERRLEDLTARIESVQRPVPVSVVDPSPPDSNQYPLPSYSLGTAGDSGLPRTISGTQIPIPSFGRNRWDSPFAHIFPERNIFEEPPENQQQPAITDNDRFPPPTENTSPPTPPRMISPQPATMTSTQPTIVTSTQPTTITTGSMSSSPYQLPSSQQPQQQQQQQQQGDSIWPQGDEAEASLNEYRKRLAHLFPFAVVPPHLSSTEMREQRPLFWKAIMMESCLFDAQRKAMLGKELLREISEAAFMNPQKTLDLLQGLQMLIAWNHYNFNTFQMLNLLFLARSITIGLGSAELKNLPSQGDYDSERLEQMRAFAGTYYLVTITFTTNKRPDALMNTSYLATCCRALHRQREHPTDELVVHLVRAQQLSQSISQGFARRKAGQNESQVPQAAFVQVLQGRIQAFVAALPPHIRADQSLAGHLQVAEILIYENSVDELHAACRSGSTGAVPTSMKETAPEHIEMLWASARLVHSFLTNRLSSGNCDYPRFIRLSSFDLTYVFLTLLKLVTLKAPGWDLARVREELRFDEVVTSVIKQMEHGAEKRNRKSKGVIPNGRGSDHDNPGPSEEPVDLLIKLASKLRLVKDRLHANGFDSDYASSEIARVCHPAPMTLVDATEDLLQDLGGGLWQDLTTGTSEWDLLLGVEAVDWTAVYSDYNSMAEPGYAV